MAEVSKTQKVLVVGAGPVGALAALYAANRGDDVHVYELRAGKTSFILILSSNSQEDCWLSYLIFCPKNTQPCCISQKRLACQQTAFERPRIFVRGTKAINEEDSASLSY